VTTSSTPGAVRAWPASIASMRACACGERMIAAYAWPGRLTSSMKVPVPVMKRLSSRRRTDVLTIATSFI
jgi:hypothetical protein